MSSWFNMDALKDLTDKVQKAIPENLVNKSMFEKLTFTTPELTAAREKLEEEESRRERVRQMLSGMLPWETKDTERGILVEECKEAILKLSTDQETFFGPYEMPVKGIIGKGDSAKVDSSGVEDREKKNSGEAASKRTRPPSKESLDKLPLLEPLPTLLADFDFDAHVGLIQRLLKEDLNLVSMQSSLSGGGFREKTFWRNYFFHCAYVRYTAGLSIDEIWTDNLSSKPEVVAADGQTPEDSKQDEVTILFEDGIKDDINVDSEESTETPRLSNDIDKVLDPAAEEAEEDLSTSDGSGFQHVSVGEDGEPELDELEAEILRELQEL